MIPFCVGMPVKFGSGSPWRIKDLHVEEEGPYKGEFSGLIIIERQGETLTVSPDAITPVDGLPWFEETCGGAPLFHFGLDDLYGELDELGED